MKKLIFCLLVFAGFFCSAQDKDVKIINGKDYFDNANSKKQSVKSPGKKEFIIYKVKSGDGWYSIARQFKISYAELRVANKDTDDKLYPGKQLKIPADKLSPDDPYFDKNYIDAGKSSTAPVQKKETEIKYHTVVASQTLYSISKMYGVTVDEIKIWNNLKSNSIAIGQKLIVSKGEIETPKPVEKEIATNKEINPNTSVTVIREEEVKQDTVSTEPEVERMTGSQDRNPSMVKDVNIPDPPVTAGNPEEVNNKEQETSGDTSSENVVFANGRHQVVESGNASVIEEEDQSQEKYYALHRTAPAGTIIRVLNMANSRKIYVKITGALSDSGDNEGILIKISRASAEKLDVTGKTFQVNLLYGLSDQ